jgi:transposase-like protein
MKIIQHTKRICPDCEEGKLTIVEYNVGNCNGVTYFQKYLVCFDCGFKIQYRQKNNARLDFEE